MIKATSIESFMGSTAANPVINLPTSLRTKIMGMERRHDWKDHAKPISRDACVGAIEFLETAFRSDPALPAPEVSPSPRGGVTLSWWFGTTGFLVRVFARSGNVYFQQEYPNFRVQTGMESREAVLGRLAGMRAPGRTS